MTGNGNEFIHGFVVYAHVFPNFDKRRWDILFEASTFWYVGVWVGLVAPRYIIQ